MSCKKEPSSRVESQNEIEIIDGRLSFKSVKSIEGLMTTLSKNKVENSNDVVSSISGISDFVSLSELLAKGQEATFSKTQSSSRSFNQQLKTMGSTGKISYVDVDYGVGNDMPSTIEELVPDPYSQVS